MRNLVFQYLFKIFDEIKSQSNFDTMRKILKICLKLWFSVNIASLGKKKVSQWQKQLVLFGWSSVKVYNQGHYYIKDNVRIFYLWLVFCLIWSCKYLNKTWEKLVTWVSMFRVLGLNVQSKWLKMTPFYKLSKMRNPNDIRYFWMEERKTIW